MRNPLKLVVVVALLASFSTTCVLAASNDMDDVRTVVEGFATAWNRHDMDAFGKLFAPDAEFVNVAGYMMKGRQDIQLHHAWSHGTVPENTFPKANPTHYGMFKQSTMKFSQVAVRLLRTDVAVARVSWELLGDSRTPRRHGVLLFVLTREDGGWLIADAQNTEINRTVK